MSSFGEKLDLFDCIYVHQPEIWPTVEAYQEVVSNGMLFCILFNIWDFCARGFATTATLILLKVQVVHHNYAWKVNYDGYVVHRNKDSWKKCREIEKSHNQDTGWMMNEKVILCLSMKFTWRSNIQWHKVVLKGKKLQMFTIISYAMATSLSN